MVSHFNITLKSRGRGFHIITEEIRSALGELPDNGLFNLFIQHTSAAITINENADYTVREDLEESFSRMVREDEPWYKHTIEGSDDMPAHIKAAMIGSSISIPIIDGQLALGTWQGIFLCEFRNAPHNREVIATIVTG